MLSADAENSSAVRYYEVVQLSAQTQLDSVRHRPLFHPALMVHSSPVDREVAWNHLSLWAADLTGSAQAARVADWAEAHASELVTVGREEQAYWDCLYEDSSNLTGIGFGIAPETEPSAAD